jgi:CBS-domain-containing membrane protein
MAADEGVAERFEKLRVKDIMIPLSDYPHLAVWSTLREAIARIEEGKIEINGRTSLPRTLLLFDLDGSLAGLVRRRDIMRGLEPRFLMSQPLKYRKKLFEVESDPALAEMFFDKMVDGVREQTDRPVTDVLQPIKQTIDVNAHMVTAVYEMVTHDLTLLPVLDNGMVVGVIRSVDVFHELARMAT